VFTDHYNDYNNNNPHIISTSEYHAAVRNATPPKDDNSDKDAHHINENMIVHDIDIHNRNENYIVDNKISEYIYNTERDDAPLGLSLLSHNIEHGAGTLTLSNIVSGVVNSHSKRGERYRRL
jgi:hypothetical protein